MKQNGKKVSQNGTKHLLELEKKVDDMKKKYSRFLEERERRRRRQQDVHFTSQDQQVLIKSFVIGGLIETGIRKILI